MGERLTERFVKSLKPPERGQVDYWDREIPGFGLRISQGGRKAWVLMYRHKGHLKRLSMGTHPAFSVIEARKVALRILGQVQSGRDPALEKKQDRDADTFNSIADRYMKEHAERHKKPASIYEDQKMLNRELRPAWGSRKVMDIRRRDVMELIDKIALRAPTSANRILSLASGIFNFAVSREVIEFNPASRIRKPGEERSRERVLSDDEIVAVWRALDSESPIISALFRTLLLTGQRRGEVINMPWAELDLDTGWWVLPKDRTKNGRLHRIPLTDQVIDILTSLRMGATSSFVFPGKNNDKPLINTHKALTRIIRQSGIAPFSLHDLRRTCGTGMAAARVPLVVISKVLNHVTMETGGSKITMVYDRHTYDQQKREALTAWSDHVRALLEVPANQSVG